MKSGCPVVIDLTVSSDEEEENANAARAPRPAPDAAKVRSPADAAAADLLCVVLGEDVVAGLRHAFAHGGAGLSAVIPLLLGRPGKPHPLAAATRAAAAAARSAGRADVGALMDGGGDQVGAAAEAAAAAETSGAVQAVAQASLVLEYDHAPRCHDVDCVEGNGHTHLTNAVKEGNTVFAQLLVDSGKVNVNFAPEGACNMFALAVACGSDWDSLGSAACTKILLGAAGVDVNQGLHNPEYSNLDDYYHEPNGNTALHFAAMSNDADSVRFLLAAEGIDVNKTNVFGRTALHHAMAFNPTYYYGANKKERVARQLMCVQALLAANVDASICDSKGVCALNMLMGSTLTSLQLASMSRRKDEGKDKGKDEEENLLQSMVRNLVHAVAKAKVPRINSAALPDEGGGRWPSTMLHFFCEMAVRAAEYAGLGDFALEMVSFLLVAGACRFALNHDPCYDHLESRTPLDFVRHEMARRSSHAHAMPDVHKHDPQMDRALVAILLSGVEYWRRKHHGGHAWAMKEVVKTLLLVDQRLDAQAVLNEPAGLPYLPKELWLAMCGFLRSADFVL